MKPHTVEIPEWLRRALFASGFESVLLGFIACRGDSVDAVELWRIANILANDFKDVLLGPPRDVWEVYQYIRHLTYGKRVVIEKGAIRLVPENLGVLWDAARSVAEMLRKAGLC